MIDKTALTEVINNALQGTQLFLVGVTIGNDNVIEVEIDGDVDVKIDDCVTVNDAVLAAFDRDKEDYQLTVGSSGLTSPLRVKRQYLKNIGNDVEVLTADGRKLKGELSEAGDDDFTILIATKVKPEGKKRPEIALIPTTLKYSEIKYTKNIIQFK